MPWRRRRLSRRLLMWSIIMPRK
ncbi:hypothetical protein Golob_014673 [Gossypium lobatum]|uniref:Uncharacterized protein n=1 Tax=Gossypium lobatum TaxID=34289 RepID=A0A7J8LYS4_9ROSI|nr:hypothetical protein [Gossypium lobatum]